MKQNVINENVLADLSTHDLKELYSLFSRTNGYTEVPPTISEFISSEYYIGESLDFGANVFPFWKEQLVDIYPTPFYVSNKYKVILLSGATGIGKCQAYEQEMDFMMSAEDIEKYGLEEYILEE